MSVDDELIDRFLDGDASEDELAQIAKWLESAANLQRFAERAELHGDLRRLLRRKRIQDKAIETCEPMALAANSGHQTMPAASAVGSRAMTKLACVAFATAVCLLVAFALRNERLQPTSQHGKVAVIVSEIDALLVRGDSNWSEADLVAGDYQLRAGLLHLQFDGGVMVYVEAPAEFDVVSGARIVLQHGRLSASVPPEGIGFTVETPEAEVVDFGTEFSIDVESGTSEVHVFDGLVRVQPKSKQSAMKQDAIDVRTSQAVKINESIEKPFDIELATDRFIRNFDEPRRKYIRALRQLSPVAFYRMAIRDQGLLAEPPQFSGEVLTGQGGRPAHARGVFAGGSLRVGAGSTGRGGRVNRPPTMTTGQFAIAVFVYREGPASEGILATNFHDEQGCFELSFDDDGVAQVSVRQSGGQMRSVLSRNPLGFKRWRHLVATVGDDQLRLYEDGQLVVSTPCESMPSSTNETVWFGTDSTGLKVWHGRIDELALFDKTLSGDEITKLYQAAFEEIASSK